MFDSSMMDKLETLQIRLEEILNELNEPAVAGDSARFQKLMRIRQSCSRWWIRIRPIRNVRRRSRTA